jgi:serine/threonine protein kinase
MALITGTKLGPYEIISALGAGGMGEVYRARDTRLDRTVAVKILANHLSSSVELKVRFEREGRAISSLNRGSNPWRKEIEGCEIGILWSGSVHQIPYEIFVSRSR